MRERILLLAFLILLSACGGSGAEFNSNVPTQMPPFIGSVVPASASPGETVTINGFGFSMVAPMNIVSFGSNSTTAATYTPNPGAASDVVESLTVNVPAGAAAGDVVLFVTVYNNTSAYVDFTINP